MLVLVVINIDGEEKIEMIPSFPGHLNYSRTLISEGSGGERVMLPTYLVVLHNIGQMTHQLENICRLGQPVVITREEGFVAVKHNRHCTLVRSLVRTSTVTLLILCKNSYKILYR